ncbi:MAG: hypothetical protein JXR86_16600 [Spirochaetales bacterium]|nr:hypothetical protein [Spirochaetales bacterium]
MNRCFIFLLLIVTSALSAQTFSFYNDVLTWGFVPEWDDWETNSFRFDIDRSNWSAGVEYGILTDRDSSEAGSSRIDRLSFHSGYLFHLIPDRSVKLTVETGLSFEATRKYDVLSGGDWPDNLVTDKPWNYMLSLAVSL